MTDRLCWKSSCCEARQQEAASRTEPLLLSRQSHGDRHLGSSHGNEAEGFIHPNITTLFVDTLGPSLALCIRFCYTCQEARRTLFSFGARAVPEGRVHYLRLSARVRLLPLFMVCLSICCLPLTCCAKSQTHAASTHRQHVYRCSSHSQRPGSGEQTGKGFGAVNPCKVGIDAVNLKPHPEQS